MGYCWFRRSRIRCSYWMPLFQLGAWNLRHNGSYGFPAIMLFFRFCGQHCCWYNVKVFGYCRDVELPRDSSPILRRKSLFFFSLFVDWISGKKQMRRRPTGSLTDQRLRSGKVPSRCPSRGSARPSRGSARTHQGFLYRPLMWCMRWARLAAVDIDINSPWCYCSSR